MDYNNIILKINVVIDHHRVPSCGFINGSVVSVWYSLANIASSASANTKIAA